MMRTEEQLATEMRENPDLAARVQALAARRGITNMQARSAIGFMVLPGFSSLPATECEQKAVEAALQESGEQAFGGGPAISLNPADVYVRREAIYAQARGAQRDEGAHAPSAPTEQLGPMDLNPSAVYERREAIYNAAARNAVR